jgi:RNA polymerase sigma-70 factor (ECF subfamily)
MISDETTRSPPAEMIEDERSEPHRGCGLIARVVEATCAVCGRSLPARTGAGRASTYCSAACRQKAYRQRGPANPAVPELIAELGQRVQALRPSPPAPFYDEVSELAAGVGRLRRIAKVARDAAGDSVTEKPVTERVTPELGTGSALADLPDSAEFAAAVEPHRRELQVHCYRMVGSYDDAEDLVQETLLKAWRARADFAGRSTLRAWLYRIATNVCLDFVRRNARQPLRYESVPGIDHGDGEPPDKYPWLQPFPDDAAPDLAAESRETLELVVLTALQHLPPQQRAVLMYRDVLDFSAADTAEQLGLTVAAVNSALQRARPTLRERLPADRSTWRSTEISQREREILDRYVQVAATGDVDAMADLLAVDAVLTMPPNPFWFTSREAIINFVRPTFDPSSPMYFGQWRHIVTRANGQLAAAGYVRRPGTNVYRPQNIDVLRIVDGRIAEITTFEPHLFPAFGLPRTLR